MSTINVDIINQSTDTSPVPVVRLHQTDPNNPETGITIKKAVNNFASPNGGIAIGIGVGADAPENAVGFQNTVIGNFASKRDNGFGNTILGYGPIHKDPINNYVVMDNLFATSYDTIKKLSSLPLTPFRDIHNVLASHFVENDIIVQSFKGESDLSIVRSNARLLEPHQLTIENIKDKAKHWRNAYCL
jgi:hypothetical protein